MTRPLREQNSDWTLDVKVLPDVRPDRRNVAVLVVSSAAGDADLGGVGGAAGGAGEDLQRQRLGEVSDGVRVLAVPGAVVGERAAGEVPRALKPEQVVGLDLGLTHLQRSAGRRRLHLSDLLHVDLVLSVSEGQPEPGERLARSGPAERKSEQRHSGLQQVFRGGARWGSSPMGSRPPVRTRTSTRDGGGLLCWRRTGFLWRFGFYRE